jgi:hypothetical protein
MRIAVLIAGEYREFPIAHKFWTFLNWPNVDCYFATWDKSVCLDKNPHIPVIVEDITEHDITKFINPIAVDIAISSPIQGCSTASKQINRWKTAITLLVDAKRQYDKVILIRPDIALDYDEEFLKKFIEENICDDTHIYSITGGTLNTPFPLEESRKVSDLILIGTQNSILKLLDIDDIESTEHHVDIHRYLAKYFLSTYSQFRNLPIPRQCVVRSNCRGLSNPTFATCKSLARDWWESKYHRFYDMGENVWPGSSVAKLPKKCPYSANRVNLWNWYNFATFGEALMSFKWHAPDNEQTFRKNSLKNALVPHNKTYGENDIAYSYTSRGYRAGAGPSEFEDAQKYKTLMVSGCSLTEGVGLPEDHIWHSFLTEMLCRYTSSPIAKLNLGKGGRSLDAAIRYVYAAIEHDNASPDMVYFLFPPVTRKELIMTDDENIPYVWDYLGYLPDSATHNATVAHEAMTKNINYRQLYHDCFRSLLFIKYFLQSKNIPWFFSFWCNDLSAYNIAAHTEDINIDCSMPEELKKHYVDAHLRDKEFHEKRFEQTIARDYAHPGPNEHYDLAKQMHQQLQSNTTFVEIIKKWKKDENK